MIPATMLSNAMTKGKRGGDYMTGDFGKVGKLKEIGVHSKKIPSFILPDSHRQTVDQGHEDCRDSLTQGPSQKQDEARHDDREDDQMQKDKIPTS